MYIYIYIVRELRRVQRERELGQGRGIPAQRDFETVSFVRCQFALRVIHGGALPVASLLSFLSPTFFASLSAYSFPPRTRRASPSLFPFNPSSNFPIYLENFEIPRWIYRSIPLSMFILPSSSRILNPFNCSTFTFENFLSKIFARRCYIWEKIKEIGEK